ncbi:hypothetical protein [Methanohalophilus portucalensis]|uniref:hypothetical protein n=1 Tax=Methanohalophilus portucalensis TaxID=39664 RepID=UPI00117CF516|nr:hypothetical protein [Methanohalophilus portucalensis]
MTSFQESLDQDSLKEVLLQNTQQTIMLNSQNEFSYLLDKIGGNEDLQDVGQYLFEEGYRRLASDSQFVMEDLIVILSEVFYRLTDSFKEYIVVENISDKNVSVRVGQLIRFFNFINALKKAPSYTSIINPREVNLLESNLDEIKVFIFANSVDWKPNREYWGKQYKDLEKLSYSKNIGYEPYYAAGVVEIIRTISNKKRHPAAFRKNFETTFNFYNDFHQMIGVYNLSLYAFIELLEAWVSLKPFIDNYIN